MKEFGIGDPVFDLRSGNGTVEKVYSSSFHPVVVRFNDKRTMVYTADGKKNEANITPMLYHGHNLIFESREPERFYVNLYWNNVVEKEHIKAGLWPFNSKEEAKTHELKSHKYIKTVEILK